MKAFYSTAIAAITITTIITATVLLVAQNNSYETTNENTYAKTIADRAYDANASHKKLVADATMDAAYAVHGCSGTGDFCTTANNTYLAYLPVYSTYLTDSWATLNATSQKLACFQTVTETGFNATYNYSTNTSFYANSTTAKTNYSNDNQLITISILNYVTETYNTTQTCRNEVPMRIKINDSSGTITDYYINCTETPIALGPIACPV